MWPPPRRIGQLLGGKYRVQQLLALGGMGVIYGACHERTGRAVAIKLLRPELATRPELMRRVSIEARLAVEASHPNVVEVLDAGEDDAGIPYVVLERLYGQPLEALLGERLSPLAAAQAVLPVMGALIALHAAGIVHRDIKPSNIFLSCESDRVIPKLLDFGIAKALASTELSSVAFGTPSYMAPEQALGCFAQGPATDVWSLSVVLVRCLSGRLPFSALPERGPSASSFALSASQLEHVPEPIGAVLSRALELDPRDRFESMGEFRSALLGALREVDVHQPWPSEATVAYAFEECAPSLRSLAPDALHASVSSEHDRAARAAELVTRTLSRAWQTVHAWRPRRLVPVAALALAMVVVLLSSRDSGVDASSQSGQSSRLAEPPGQRASAPAPAPSDVAGSLHASTSGSSASERDPLLPTDAVAAAGKATPNVQQKLRRPRLLEAEDDQPAPTEPESASVPLGPNRSPIIE